MEMPMQPDTERVNRFSDREEEQYFLIALTPIGYFVSF
jgi:hypothetical protein